jgi:hypothetical protein
MADNDDDTMWEGYEDLSMEGLEYLDEPEPNLCAYIFLCCFIFKFADLKISAEILTFPLLRTLWPATL